LTLGWRRGTGFALAPLIPLLAWSLNISAPITTSGGTSLFIGTYPPGDGALPRMKRALKAQAQALDPTPRHNRHAAGLPGGRVLNAVAARHPELGHDAALRAEAWHNVATYAPAHPLAFARMELAKLPRMWLTPSPRARNLRGTPLRVWHLAIVLLALLGALRL